MMRVVFYVYIFVCLSGCIESSYNKRFIVDNQQPEPIPTEVYNGIFRDLNNLRDHDANQEQTMAKIGGEIADLNTHLSRTDASINDLIKNRTSCSCPQDINIGNAGLHSPELQNISQNIDDIYLNLHKQESVTSNLSSVTKSISRQVSGTYNLLEELISIPAAHELKLALQNSDLHTIFGNITSAHTQSTTCTCNISRLSSQLSNLGQGYQILLTDMNNIKAHNIASDDKLSDHDRTIQTLQQKLNDQEQQLNSKDAILNDLTSQIHQLKQDLNRQQIIVQNLTSEKTTLSTTASSLDDKIQSQQASIKVLSSTLGQQQHFISSLLGWLADTVQLPCTTGSIHNLCPAGTNEIHFRHPFHALPSMSASASLFHIPSRAVVSHMTPTIDNVTQEGFRIAVTCGSDSNYAIEATWKACVIPLVETDTK